MRHQSDAVFVRLALLHGVVLLAAPAAPVVALGIWWNSNTIAHQFIHRPFFLAPALNAAFSIYQSVLLGIPQTVYRQRHLAHHRDEPWHWRASPMLVVETSLILSSWFAMAAMSPKFFGLVYLPGYAAGLLLCGLHGHYEHVRAMTTSHYGRVYNWLFFNDGYHCEHHAFPGISWTALPGRRPPTRHVSRWPPVFRWLDGLGLDGLERLLLHVPVLQRVVVDAHVRALVQFMPHLNGVSRVGIVGGGLFPRTVLVLRRLLPNAQIVVLEANEAHIQTAHIYLRDRLAPDGRAVQFRHEVFDATAETPRFDLIVIPLAFVGSRDSLYERPPAPFVLVHDWYWRTRGEHSVVVSPWLLKRINLVRR